MSKGVSDRKSTSKAQVLTVGLAVADYVFQTETIPAKAEKHFAHDQFEVVGGIAVNAALAIQSLGGQAHLLSRTGDDGAGRLLHDTISATGIDLSLLETVSGQKSASSAVIVDATGERMIVNHRSEALFRDPPSLSASKIRRMDAVLGDMRWIEATAVAFERAREAAIPTVLDFDLTDTEVPSVILDGADYIIFGEAALKRFSRRVDVLSALKAAKTKHPAAQIAVTAGQDGVHFINRDGKLLHIPARDVDVKSTLGAGDIFHGAAALAIAEKQSFERALRFANDVAALKVSQPANHTSFPTRSDVDAFQRSTT